MLVDQINRSYIPIGIEHDPRIPPQGRVVSARLSVLDDGANAVETEMELFEPGDSIPLDNSLREIPVRDYDPNKLEISYDKNYRDQESQLLIQDIADLLGTSPQEEAKKSLDPLSVLTIAGAFLLGGIAAGFLNKLGADVWDTLKTKTKQLIDKKREKVKDNLLLFEFSVPVAEQLIAARVILTNPSGEDIEDFFENGLRDLDEILVRYVDLNIGLKVIVFESSEGKLRVLFGVRKDAVPLFPAQQEEQQSVKSRIGADGSGTTQG